ncbi:hypothetical protein [Shimia sp.]|uniref:hypothetical protein n=1 Tax=Shimia sp. TaxID=1954381 RepID=UPI003565C2CE
MKHLILKRFLAQFRHSENGAVTVDWIVITAGALALAIASMALIEAEATSLASDTGVYLAARAN